MYCLQWLLPVLLIPKPLNPALWFNHSMFMGFYLLSFLLERKPCTICALVFLAALFLICYSCWGTAFFTTAMTLHCQMLHMIPTLWAPRFRILKKFFAKLLGQTLDSV